eukprot:Gb_23811 [translate_table: standard]
MCVQRYRVILTTFLTLIPSLAPYLGILFCVMCLYCSLGLQLFGGLVYSGNPKLEGTGLLEDDYLLFNFNDYPSGMVTLFNLVIMGNWQNWMESYAQLSRSSWALVYFVSFYVITVLLLLNLVIAFVLEAFFAQMELESSSGNDEPEQIDTQDSKESSSHQKHARFKARSGRVQMLLHHILSAELELEKNTSGGEHSV